MINALEQYDPQIFELIRQESARQSGSIRLIPSENYVSKAVMLASGSCLTNKYAEGYPGKRYYEGQQVTDLIERLATGTSYKIIQGRPCQCSALFRLSSKSGRLFGTYQSR